MAVSVDPPGSADTNRLSPTRITLEGDDDGFALTATVDFRGWDSEILDPLYHLEVGAIHRGNDIGLFREVEDGEPPFTFNNFNIFNGPPTGESVVLHIRTGEIGENSPTVPDWASETFEIEIGVGDTKHIRGGRRDPFNQSCDNRRVAVEIEDDGGYVEIPTHDVETTVSREGVSNKNRLTEVEFPAEWYGDDVLGIVDAFDPETQDRYDRATVKFQDVSSGEWWSVHHGYVRSVGATSNPNRLRLWVGDPSDFLSAIPVSATYGPDTTVSQVFEDAAETFESNTIYSGVAVRGVSQQPVSEEANVDEDPSLSDIQLLPDIGAAIAGEPQPTATSTARAVSKSSRSFKANRNVLADILEWITEVVGGTYYFEYEYPEDDFPHLSLVYDPRPTQQTFTDQHTDGGISINVIENDAIAEMDPITALRVNGQSRASLSGFTKSMKQGEIPATSKWPTATVRHTPLSRRTGMALAPPVAESDTATVDATIEFARRELKRQMGGAPQGDILAYGAPFVEPYDQLRSQPICNGSLDPRINVPPLDYEIERVVHQKESGKEMKTRMEVSVYVDMNDIEVVEDGLTDGSDVVDDEGTGGILTFGLPTLPGT